MIFGYPSSYGDYASEVLPTEYLLSGVGRPVSNTGGLNGINLFVLYGGEDISTCWYGERPVKSHSPHEFSMREAVESRLVDECFKKGIPVLGICRGAQFLCAYLGGSVWQHVDNHDGRDHVLHYGDRILKTNSYHHQMMRPNEDMEILATSDNLSPIKWSESPHEDLDQEVEILYHRSKKVLMIQGHPEWVNEDHDLFKLTQELVKELLCQ